MTDSTAEERERMARAVAVARWGKALDPLNSDYAVTDILRAAGYSDVAAERARREEAEERADSFQRAIRDVWSDSALYGAIKETALERDALQARIDAALTLMDTGSKRAGIRTALAEDQPAAAPEADAWRDRQGDLWRLGDDGLMHSRDTVPFSREHVEKKWGPLLPVATPEPPHLDPERYEYAVCWTADNGNVIAFADTITAWREGAYAELDRMRARETEWHGRPDLMFVGRRPVPIWSADYEEQGRG